MSNASQYDVPIISQISLLSMQRSWSKTGLKVIFAKKIDIFITEKSYVACSIMSINNAATNFIFPER